jgi:hypothetical protein
VDDRESLVVKLSCLDALKDMRGHVPPNPTTGNRRCFATTAQHARLVRSFHRNALRLSRMVRPPTESIPPRAC